MIGIVEPFVFITQGAETKSGTPFRFHNRTVLLRAASTRVVFPIKQRSCADSQLQIDELTAHALLKRTAILLKIKGHLNSFIIVNTGITLNRQMSSVKVTIWLEAVQFVQGSFPGETGED